jgi:hypothetical protein
VAEGEATAKFGKDGVKASLGGNAGTEASVSAKFGDQDDNIKIGVSAGNVGAGVSGDAKVGKDKVTLSGCVKLALGVGA